MEADKKRKKMKRWPSEQIEMLIEMWAERIDELRGARRNNHVFQEMQVALLENGVESTADDIKVRIHNLTSKYRKEKSKIGSSGGSPSEWPLYDKIHAILGQHAIHNLESLVEDSIMTPDAEMPDDIPVDPEEYLDHQELLGSPDLEGPLTPGLGTRESGSSQPRFSQTGLSTPKAGKKKKDTFQAEILKRWDIMEEQTMAQENRMREINEQIFQQEARRTELLERFVQDSSEVKEAFIDFLNSRR